MKTVKEKESRSRGPCPDVLASRYFTADQREPCYQESVDNAILACKWMSHSVKMKGVFESSTSCMRIVLSCLLFLVLRTGCVVCHTLVLFTTNCGFLQRTSLDSYGCQGLLGISICKILFLRSFNLSLMCFPSFTRNEKRFLVVWEIQRRERERERERE